MRILHIDKFLHSSDAAGGGVGRYIRTISRELRRRGHTTDDFGCADQAGPVDRPAFVDFTDAAGPLQFLCMLHNPSAATMLRKYLRGHAVDVAHLHNIYHHLTASILPVLEAAGVGVVMTVHDYRQIGKEKLFWRWGMGDPNGGREDEFLREAHRRCAGLGGLALRLRGWIERTSRWYARRVDAFLCPTRFMCDEVALAGVPRDKIIYSPIPVEIGDEPPAADDGKTLLFVGRLGVEKSPDLLLSVAKRLPSTRVVLAGDGPMRESLHERCRRDGLSNVEILGQVSSEEMTQWYARATAVVVTSRCMENSPVAMLEALAAGRCVIAPDQPSLREWITDGQTGCLYPTGDVAKLLRVIQDVLEKEPLRHDMGAAGRKKVEKQHELTSAVSIIEQAYEEARRRCALR